MRADFDTSASCYLTEQNGALVPSFNVASDNTASGTGSVDWATTYTAYFVDATLVGGRTTATTNLHILGPSASLWGPSGTDLSADFSHDVDSEQRSVPWDIGADEFGGTTAVKLMSFDALPADGEVSLAWRTGSEISNLGFHVYRGPSAEGPWTRLTASLVPGLGNSAVGQSYSWRDSGLVNGVRYFYRLEDVDTASVATMHGPISAVPAAGAPAEGGGGEPGGGSGPGPGGSVPLVECPAWVRAASGAFSSSPACTRHGDPDAVSLEVVSRQPGSVTLELRTGGFWALHEAAGTVRVFVPGLDTPQDPAAPALPVRRALVEAVVGKKVRLVSAEPLDLYGFPGLRPSAVGLTEMDVARDGTVRPGRRAVAAPRLSRGYLPQFAARLAGSVFQGETKSAVVEISPVRFDGYRQQLVLARRVKVRLLYSGQEAEETGAGSQGRAVPRQPAPFREVLAQLHTSRRGLHAVSFEDLFPIRRRGLATSLLRLQRQGQTVAFHVEPASPVFGPGSTLFFFADRVSSSTDFSSEVAWELVRSTAGVPMATVLAPPVGAPVSAASLAFSAFEANRIYQPGLLDAPDIWLWESLVGGGAARSVPFAVSGLDTLSAQAARLTIDLQGGSASGLPEEHHVRVSLRGTTIGEARFEGKEPCRLSLDVPVSLLAEGTNTLDLVNLGDGGVDSLVFLDKLGLAYPQAGSLRGGLFEGAVAVSGAVEIGGVEGASAVLDVTTAVTWLTGVEPGPGSVRFQVEAGHRYLVASREGILSPRLARPALSTLRDPANQADYVLVAPRSFLDAARPLARAAGGPGPCPRSPSPSRRSPRPSDTDSPRPRPSATS